MTQTDLMRFSLLLKEYYDSTKRDVFARRGDVTRPTIVDSESTEYLENIPLL